MLKLFNFTCFIIGIMVIIKLSYITTVRACFAVHYLGYISHFR